MAPTSDRTIASSRPLPLLPTVLICAVVAAAAIAAMVAGQGDATTTEPRYAATRLIVSAILLLAYPWWRLRHLPDHARPARGRPVTAALVIPPAVLLAFVLVAIATSGRIFLGWSTLALFALSMLSVGVFEEVLARGFVLGLIARARDVHPGAVWAPAIWSAVIFGFGHLSNVPRTGIGVTLVQCLYATLVGLYFAANRFRTGRLWPLIIAHAVIDFSFYLGSDVYASPDHPGQGVNPTLTALLPVIFGLVLGAWGILDLRRLARQADTRPSARTGIHA